MLTLLLQVRVQLHSDPQTQELLVHPDASINSIYQQLQLALEDTGLVVIARVVLYAGRTVSYRNVCSVYDVVLCCIVCWLYCIISYCMLGV